MEIDLKVLKKIVRLITRTLPDYLVEKVGHDKLAHGFMTAYAVSVLEHFGPLWGVGVFILLVFLGYTREMLSETPDYNDAKWMVIFGAAELVRFNLFSIL